jgi:hypothetical protein
MKNYYKITPKKYHVPVMERFIFGNVDDIYEEIDDAIDYWHHENTNIKLHEFLGMTQDEYDVFVTSPNMFISFYVCKHN